MIRARSREGEEVSWFAQSLFHLDQLNSGMTQIEKNIIWLILIVLKTYGLMVILQNKH